MGFSYFFAVTNLKGERYIEIRSIFDAGVIEIGPYIDAITPQNLGNQIVIEIYVWRVMQCKRKFVRARSTTKGSRCKLGLKAIV